MATLKEKIKTIEAVQFVDSSDASDDLGIAVRPYHLDDGERLCSKCGKALSLHGVVDRAMGWGTVCPGTWFLAGGGELSDTEILARYEEVKGG